MPPSVVSVYPQYNGAVGLENWEGRCQGQPCSFYLSTSRNAGCLGFEPNGDNNVNNAIYLVDHTVCDYGHWNDANNTISAPSQVIRPVRWPITRPSSGTKTTYSPVMKPALPAVV